MSLRLEYLSDDAMAVELAGLTPDAVADKSLADIERLPLLYGSQEAPLAELFRVAGDPRDRRIDLDGNLAGVHWIGANMRDGEIVVHQPAGRHVGSGMRGGKIHVRGDAANWLGAEMHGGLIRVDGRAGDLVGAAYRGSPKGMTGGTILVGGDAGNEVGRAMRRGTIAVGGSTGELAGYDMLAGSIVALGNLGQRAGAGMRRGTICSFGGSPPQRLPGFRYACTARPPVLALMLRALREQGLPLDESHLAAKVDLYNGDFLTLGRGEMFLRSAAD